MATIGCDCPVSVSGKNHVHVPTCPNRKRRGKGQQPREYMGTARVPRDYSHARLAVEHLREVLLRMAAAAITQPTKLAIADCRMQCETVRRYLDGE